MFYDSYAHNLQQNVLILMIRYHESLEPCLSIQYSKFFLINLLLTVHEGKRLYLLRMLSCRLVQGRAVIQHGMFGEDWIMFSEVITVLCFMAKHQNVPRRHGYTVQRNSTTTHGDHVRIIPTKFETAGLKAVGRVC